jgi:hypothetical protein
MKKLTLVLPLFLFLLTIMARAQDKKVAVVSFYINKKLDISGFGAIAYLAEKLGDDPNFNMKPLLDRFHKEFFENYSKDFPFQLLPEDQVTNTEAYKAFVPVGIAESGVLEATKYIIPVDGYKILLQNLIGHNNEKNMVKLFNQADGVMDVSISYKLVKIGFANMGVVKIEAEANISLFNKNGDRVFHIEEDAKSKNMSPLVGGVPVMTPEKILPMCESSTDELMIALQKDMPKLIKKSDAKL